MVEDDVHSAFHRLKAIVFGGSSGGFEALTQILSSLPADFPYPILVVLHRGATPDPLLERLLARSCHLAVKEAEEKETIVPGVVYVAPANYHMMVELNHTLSLTVDQRVCYARPSIDVLFETAADAYRDRLAGILLTGANNDGTTGLTRIKAMGGTTVVQDPMQARAPTMPSSAIEAGVVDYTLTLKEITTVLQEICAGTGSRQTQGA